MSFTNYLEQKRLSAKTIEVYTHDSHHFLTWLQKEDIAQQTFTYNDLLEYMRYCYAAGITSRRLHTILGVVRQYCVHLIELKQRSDNPAAGVFIKGLVRKLPANILGMEELE